MARAAALIIREGALALIERRGSQPGALYYLLPGGRVEAGESPADAACRAVAEELGLQVAIGPLVARGAYRGDRQYYFVATIQGGTFGTGQGAEMMGPVAAQAGTYTPVWVPLGALTLLPVYPVEPSRSAPAPTLSCNAHNSSRSECKRAGRGSYRRQGLKGYTLQLKYGHL